MALGLAADYIPLPDKVEELRYERQKAGVKKPYVKKDDPLCQQSVKLGFHRNYLSRLQNEDSAERKYLRTLDENIAVAVGMQQKIKVETQMKMRKMHETLTKNDSHLEFGREIMRKNIFSGQSNIRSFFKAVLSTPCVSFNRHSSFVKALRILEEYKEYEENTPKKA